MTTFMGYVLFPFLLSSLLVLIALGSHRATMANGMRAIPTMPRVRNVHLQFRATLMAPAIQPNAPPATDTCYILNNTFTNGRNNKERHWGDPWHIEHTGFSFLSKSAIYKHTHRSENSTSSKYSMPSQNSTTPTT